MHFAAVFIITYYFTRNEPFVSGAKIHLESICIFELEAVYCLLISVIHEKKRGLVEN